MPIDLQHQILGWVLGTFYIFLKVFFYYISFFITFLLLRVFYRLRKQVFNCDLKDKPSKQQAVLITGATSGIGLALARHLHRRGYSVIAGYFTTAEPGYEELKKLDEEKKGENSIYFVELDVRFEESIARSYDIVKKILADYGLELHALVNNAGIANVHRPQYVSQTSTRALVETNLLGPMMMTKKFLPLLITASSGRLVNVSSLMAFMPMNASAIYGATKSGLAYYTNALPLDTRAYKVKFVTIYPGFVTCHTEAFTRATSNYEKPLEEFSDEERELYGGHFKQDCEKMNRLLPILLEDDLSQQEIKEMKLSKLLRLSLKVVSFLHGGIGGRNVQLESSSFMESFENAISLKDPPRELYAGNRFYSTFVAAFFECTSHLFKTNFLAFAAYDYM